MNYVDSCLTLQILLWDSGLEPAPERVDEEGNPIPWNTFVPKEGDVAHVDENDTDYCFIGGEWKAREPAL